MRPSFAKSDPLSWTNSSVRYSIAWPKISRARPACGAMYRGRFERTRGALEAGSNALSFSEGMRLQVVVEAAMVFILTLLFDRCICFFR